MVDRKNVQQWLQENYEDKKTSIAKIVSRDIELEGELKIKDYPSLEKILLNSTKLIKKITIENCPNVKVIIINDNQITEIEGLGGLTNLQKLNIGKNKFEKIDISKNIQLELFVFYENPKNLQFINGLKSLDKLFELNSSDTFPITTLLNQASEADLKEIAGQLKLKVEGKSKDEIKQEIIAEIEKNNQNKEKLKDPKTGLPDLLNEKGEVDKNKLEKLKNDAEKGNKYQTLLDEPANDPIKSGDKKEINQAELTKKLKAATEYEELKKHNPDLFTDDKVDQSKITGLKNASSEGKAFEIAAKNYFGDKWRETLEVAEFQNQIEVNTNK